jgi:AcrR family transcriptional regulator
MQAKKQKVVPAAIDIFLNQGIGETSMADIARNASLAAETVYGVFPRKNDILRVVGAANKAAAAGSLNERLQETPVATPTRCCAAPRRSSPPAATRCSWSPKPGAWPCTTKELNGVIRDVFDALRNQWVELATRMAAEGQLPDGADPESVGSTLGCLIVGHMVLSLLHEVIPDHLHRGLRELRSRIASPAS